MTRTNQPLWKFIAILRTSKPYSYVVVDNKADKPARRQIVAVIFGNWVSYNIKGYDSAVSVTKQTTTGIDLNEETARTYKKEDDNSKILKLNAKKGPIVVGLDKRKWSTVQEEIREAECSENRPVGWVLWRVHSIKVPGDYKQELIESRTQKRLNVIERLTNGCLRFIHNIILSWKMCAIACTYWFSIINLIKKVCLFFVSL